MRNGEWKSDGVEASMTRIDFATIVAVSFVLAMSRGDRQLYAQSATFYVELRQSRRIRPGRSRRSRMRSRLCGSISKQQKQPGDVTVLIEAARTTSPSRCEFTADDSPVDSGIDRHLQGQSPERRSRSPCRAAAKSPAGSRRASILEGQDSRRLAISRAVRQRPAAAAGSHAHHRFLSRR